MPPAADERDQTPAPDPEAIARRRDAALAGHHGDQPAARQALNDPAPSVRATALAALARMGQLRPEDLAAAAGDQAVDVRVRAAELAAGRGRRGSDLAERAVRDPDPRVVEAGCFALGEIGDVTTTAVAALAGVGREHPDPLCREAAVAALGAIGDPRGLPVILGATHDKPAVRRRAVLALAPFEGPEVDAALEEAGRDRDWQVRQAAEDLQQF